MIRTICLGAALFAAAANVYAANRPDGYSTICGTDQSCSVTGPTQVAFGADGKFAYKTFSGAFKCNAAAFGTDPNPNKTVKECSIPSARSSDAIAGGNADGSAPIVSAKAASGECVAGATIRDKSIDCGGKTIGLSCKVGDEFQKPVLTLINASVKNVRISKNGGSDGIHCKSGNCTLQNVVWEDICEDAASNLSEGGTMTIIGGSAYNDTVGPGGKPDKVFQQNSKNSTTRITGGFTLKGEHGKLWRSCGDCVKNGGPRRLIVDNITIEGKVGSVAGVNRNYGDKATITNLRIKGYQSGKPKVCEEYKGVVKNQGTEQKYGEFWDTQYCDVSRSDVRGY